MSKKVSVDYEDGRFWLLENGPLEISDTEWELYQAHRQAEAIWQRYLSKLDNKMIEEHTI